MNDILNKKLIDKTAKDLYPVSSSNRYSFKSGVTWCRGFYEKLISELIVENQGLKLNQDKAIEFAEWICKNDYHGIKNDKTTSSWFILNKHNSECDTNELFKKFSEDRNI